MQTTVAAVAPYAFPQNQKIQNFNFSEKFMASVLWGRKGILSTHEKKYSKIIVILHRIL
jgi:hypothetical protein